MPKFNVDTLRISRICDLLRSRTELSPTWGIILGTGLGGLEKMISVDFEISYDKIPGFPKSQVQSHANKLIIGKIGAQPIMAFSGRFHYYEGFSMQEVTLPVRVMQQMEVKKMLVSNAAGGLNPSFQAGDLVVIQDHINFFQENPLRGKNDSNFGLRFPDMLHAYDPQLLNRSVSIANESEVSLKKGVYLGLSGPSLETPAEYRLFHQWGADLVGMSTVPEVIAARHAGLRVLAFSIVSNVCFPTEKLTKTTVEDVIATVQTAAPNLLQIVQNLLQFEDQKSA